jgi:hypothetical protein
MKKPHHYSGRHPKAENTFLMLRGLFLPYNRQFTGFHRLTNNRYFTENPFPQRG